MREVTNRQSNEIMSHLDKLRKLTESEELLENLDDKEEFSSEDFKQLNKIIVSAFEDVGVEETKLPLNQKILLNEKYQAFKLSTQIGIYLGEIAIKDVSDSLRELVNFIDKIGKEREKIKKLTKKPDEFLEYYESIDTKNETGLREFIRLYFTKNQKEYADFLIYYSNSPKKINFILEEFLSLDKIILKGAMYWYDFTQMFERNFEFMSIENEKGETKPIEIITYIISNIDNECELYKKLEENYPELIKINELIKSRPELLEKLGITDIITLQSYISEDTEYNDEFKDKVIDLVINKGLSINLKGENSILDIKNVNFINNPKDAEDYFEVAIKLATDQGISLRRNAIRAFNLLYEQGYRNGEKDQIEVSKQLSNDILLKLLLNCDESNLNITHKILHWHIVGERSKGINAIDHEFINTFVRNLNKKEKGKLFNNYRKRKGRDSEFMNLLEKDLMEEVVIAGADAIFENITSPEKIINIDGLGLALSNEIYGKIFAKQIVENLVDEKQKNVFDRPWKWISRNILGNNDSQKILEFLAVSYDSIREACVERGLDLGEEKIEEIENKLNKLTEFETSELLSDNIYRSVSLFVYDPENTNDSDHTNPNESRKDKIMQLNSFYTNARKLHRAGYEVSKTENFRGNNVNKRRLKLSGRMPKLLPTAYESIKSIEFKKVVNGITLVQKLVISNNSSHQDFKEYVEMKNDNGLSKYEQIALRGHCWTTRFAIVGKDNKFKYNRKNSLLLINGGCFQEKNTKEYSDRFDSKVFQVSTTGTGIGNVTSDITMEYSESIANTYDSNDTNFSRKDEDVRKNARINERTGREAEARSYVLPSDRLLELYLSS